VSKSMDKIDQMGKDRMFFTKNHYKMKYRQIMFLVSRDKVKLSKDSSAKKRQKVINS